MKVFISHNSKDKSNAESVGQFLLDQGIDVWFDKWEIKAGESLSDKLSDGLVDAQAFLILMSPNSMSSRWVREELRVALQRRIREDDFRIIPVLLEECEIPAFLLDYVYIDWRIESNERFEALIRALKQISLKPTFIADHNTPKIRFIHTALRIVLIGEKGESAQFQDSFEGQAILDFSELSRHVYFAGEIQRASISGGLKLIRQIYTPQAEWTVYFPTGVKAGDLVSVKHEFEIEGCFGENPSYWTFAVDSPTDMLTFSLNYRDSTPVTNFRVLHRVGQTPYEEPVQPSFDGGCEYSWNKLFPTHKDTYEFHWEWR